MVNLIYVIVNLNVFLLIWTQNMFARVLGFES